MFLPKNDFFVVFIFPYFSLDDYLLFYCIGNQSFLSPMYIYAMMFLHLYLLTVPLSLQVRRMLLYIHCANVIPSKSNLSQIFSSCGHGLCLCVKKHNKNHTLSFHLRY